MILDYRLPHGKIMFQNALAHTLANNSDFKYYMDFAGQGGLTYQITRDKNYRDLLVNALEAEYNFGSLKTELALLAFLQRQTHRRAVRRPRGQL